MKQPSDDSASAKAGWSLRLDDGAISQVVAAYPESVREDVQWLAVYVRERCNRQLSVLEGVVKNLGSQLRANLAYKIFTGRYFIADPQRPGSIVGSVPNFQQVVARLRAGFRIEQQTGRIPFIETPTWSLIRDYIDVRRLADRVCKFGVIVGITGAQKSASYKEYCARHSGKCVHLETPHGQSMSQFITDLAAKFGSSVWSNQENKLRSIMGSVTASRTIILDNVQRLYNPRAKGNQPIFNFMQKLQDDTGCTVILSFTPDFEKVLIDGSDRGYFEQFEGRCGGAESFLRLPENAERDDVLAIARSFGLAIADQGEDIAYLERLAHARGKIRILFHWLQEGSKDAQMRGEPFGIEHVKAARGEGGL